MQDPNKNAVWNDALRTPGTLPVRPKALEIEDPEPIHDKIKDLDASLDELQRLHKILIKQR